MSRKRRPRYTGHSNKKVDKADKLFSLVVRKRAASPTGVCECYTCGTKQLYVHMQCGHFISREHFTTRWLFENAKPQCRKCNEGENGQLEEYARRLEEESPGIVDYLQRLKHSQVDKTTFDFDHIITELKKMEIELDAKEG